MRHASSMPKLFCDASSSYQPPFEQTNLDRCSGFHVNGMTNLSSPSRFVRLVSFSDSRKRDVDSTFYSIFSWTGGCEWPVPAVSPKTGVESEHGNRGWWVVCGEPHPGGSCDSICKTMRLFQLAIGKEKEKGKKERRKMQFAATLEPVATCCCANSGKESDPHRAGNDGLARRGDEARGGWVRRSHISPWESNPSPNRNRQSTSFISVPCLPGNVAVFPSHGFKQTRGCEETDLQSRSGIALGPGCGVRQSASNCRRGVAKKWAWQILSIRHVGCRCWGNPHLSLDWNKHFLAARLNL